MFETALWKVLGSIAAVLGVALTAAAGFWKLLTRRYATYEDLHQITAELDRQWEQRLEQIFERFTTVLQNQLGGHIHDEEKHLKGIEHGMTETNQQVGELARHIREHVPTRAEIHHSQEQMVRLHESSQRSNHDLARAIHRLADAEGANEERNE